MSKIVVLGGTGYTGGNTIREAASRGHDVTSFSRNAPADPVHGVTYRTGSLLEDAVCREAIAAADVVVGALAPWGELEGRLVGVYARLEVLAAEAKKRIGFVGGFSALRPRAGAPRFAEGEDIPAEYATEAREVLAVLEHLEGSNSPNADWFYISPAAEYGSHAAGKAIGAFRTREGVALTDETGSSAISGVDFARAILDEVEGPGHRNAQFSVAY